MFYAIFILMYIISSSNCIRIIGLPDNTEPNVDTLSRRQQFVYSVATSTSNELKWILQRRYYMYALQANPDYFNTYVVSNAQHIYNHLKQNVMYNVNIINQGILTYNQWLEVLDIYSNTAFYFTNEFAQARNRIPVKPGDSDRSYFRLCRSFMNSNGNSHLNAINRFFAPYRVTHIVSPEEETQEIRDVRSLRDDVLRYYNNMNKCNNTAWLRRLYKNEILSCESYLSYTIRTINNGKMPIPKANIPSIYDVPANFNSFINMENYDIKIEGLSEEDRDACVFMFILVNMRD